MLSAPDARQVAKDFAHEIASRLEGFKRSVPVCPEPDLPTRFLEAQVRQMLDKRLAPNHLLSGVLRMTEASGPPHASCFIDGLIYDPRRGPTAFQQSGFSVINPGTCLGYIQVKPSMSNLTKFQIRLQTIAHTYFTRQPPGSVMGVIVSDVAPGEKSVVNRNRRTFPAYQFTHGKWCPIFILFARREGQFEPYFPALEALLANVSRFAGTSTGLKNVDSEQPITQPCGPAQNVVKS